MPFDWSTLRIVDPMSLAPARAIVHHALQWPMRALRANVALARDESLLGLSWDPGTWALFSPPLPGDIRVGLRIHGPALLYMRRRSVEDGCLLVGSTAPGIHHWLDRRLARDGRKPASRARLDYDIPMPDYAEAAREGRQLAALAAWCAAAAGLLEEQRAKRMRFGVTPVRCQPRAFRLAFLAALGQAGSIEVGFSLGDRYYAQPYAYVKPAPGRQPERLTPLPRGGRWHTRGFLAAVATAADLLARPDPRRSLVEVIEAAFEAQAAGASVPQPRPTPARRAQHRLRE